MIDLDTVSNRKDWAAFRKPEEMPTDPRCKLHLQRICGTCTHYQGDLRPIDGATSAPCAIFGILRGRLDRAWHCNRWQRPDEGGAE